MSLSRADFTLEPTSVALKDGRMVRLRRFSAFERAGYLGRCKELAEAAVDKSPSEKLQAMLTASGNLVAMALIDDEGKPVFSDGVEVIKSLGDELLDELFAAICDLNGLRKAADPNA